MNCRFHDTNEGVGVMVFNATFNNISAISWRSVLFVEETQYLEKTTVPEKPTDLPQFADSTPCSPYTPGSIYYA